MTSKRAATKQASAEVGVPLDPKHVRELIEAGKPSIILNGIVTPEIANLLLEYNRAGETNRRISKPYVGLAARALLAGEWENTGEPIIVSDQKMLNDGQHRLSAICIAETPAIMDIRFGVPRHAFAATGSGRKRQSGEALALLGVSDYFSVASAARLVLCYDKGMPTSLFQTYSNTEIVGAVERWPDIVHAVGLMGNFKGSLKNGVTNALSFFALKSSKNETEYRRFFDTLKTGGGDIEAPAFVLREYLLNNSVSRDRGSRVHGLAVSIIAWNAHKSGGKIKNRKFRWGSLMDFPVVDDLTL